MLTCCRIVSWLDTCKEFSVFLARYEPKTKLSEKKSLFIGLPPVTINTFSKQVLHIFHIAGTSQLAGAPIPFIPSKTRNSGRLKSLGSVGSVLYKRNVATLRCVQALVSSVEKISRKPGVRQPPSSFTSSLKTLNGLHAEDWSGSRVMEGQTRSQTMWAPKESRGLNRSVAIRRSHALRAASLCVDDDSMQGDHIPLQLLHSSIAESQTTKTKRAEELPTGQGVQIKPFPLRGFKMSKGRHANLPHPNVHRAYPRNR